MSLGRPFWDLETKEEFLVVGGFLKRRFPELHERFTRALDAVDPYEVVYPGNPGEYDWLVWEYVILLVPYNYQITALDDAQLRRLLHRGTEGLFGEAMSDSAVDQLVAELRAD